jgi:CRISPR-associated endonuclease/helicase Cas3
MRDFESFYEQATGHRPYGYQARVARDGLPDVVRAPAGTGKTGVILAWLWRRLHGPDPAGTPRRLVYALPQRAVLDEAAGLVRCWLANLGLTDEVALHVVLGDRGSSSGDWRDNMHQPAIVVGTAETLVSKALNRGYGIAPALYPIDFGLVTNGAQWIVDEARLSPVTTVTLRQLAGWAGRRGTAEPFAVTSLSCLPAAAAGSAIEIAPPERTGELAIRLGAARTIRQAGWAAGDYTRLADAVRGLHRAGTLTLVVLNTVSAAQSVYRRLRRGPAACTLLHQQFRGVERVARLAGLAASPADRIVVLTGEAASGLDLSAATLVTEAAPWAALVRRAGRCNRTGTAARAELWWVPPAAPLPAERSAIDATCAELARLEGAAVTGEELAARAVSAAQDQVPVIGPADFAALFDTSPAFSLSGPDVDVARYVRDAADLDADVAWVTWTPGEAGAPDPGVRYPAPEFRCRVPVEAAVTLAGSRPVWRFDHVTDAWRQAPADPQWRPRPFELLLVAAGDGGYDAATGFDPSSREPVPASPELLTPDELAERAAAEAAALATAAEAAGTVTDVEDTAPWTWQSLDEHSEKVRDQAAALLAVLTPAISPEAARAAVIAGYLHDAGKAHPIWQDALCALADESEAKAIAAGRPWAKSGKNAPLVFAGGVSFRHELASLLLIDGPLRPLLAASPDPDLTQFLVLAHHGKLRLQVTDSAHSAVLPNAAEFAPVIRGLAHGAMSGVPPMLGQPTGTLTVDLGQFYPGLARSWTGTVRGLLDKYGPFTLAYLETVVRIADWRASGGRELPAA